MAKLKNDARPARAKRSLGRAAMIGAVALSLVAGGGGTAWAWWTASQSMSGLVSTAVANVVPQSTIISCKSAGFLGNDIDITFAAPANPIPAGATRSFEVSIGGQVIATKPNATQIVQRITYGDVPGFLGGGTVDVVVRTKYTFADATAPFFSSAAIQRATQIPISTKIVCG